MHFVVLLVKGDSAFEMQLNSFFEYLIIQNMQLHFMMKQINNIIHSLKLNPMSACIICVTKYSGLIV